MEESKIFSLEDVRVTDDRSTYSNYKEVKTNKIHFDWFVNFETSQLEGRVTLKMTALTDVQTVILDSWQLNIINIPGATFKLGEEKDIGSKLEVTLDNKVTSGSDFDLEIEYTTLPNSSALSWLQPDQTLDKEHPFLFSQSEPIYARCIFPCQDTPSIKTSYTAKTKVKNPLTVLLSADVVSEETTEDGFKITEFNMPMPIPSYLVSICAGNLAFRKIGERCGIYAEESYVDTCAAEFEDMEKFLKVGEEILFEYPLKNYFVVILPPSFPYGGMENPITTFATPTIVVGDKSAVNVVCHEITHSWTGNYLTNSNWEDFWLNEGFTRYIEAKMIHRLYGDNAHKLHLKEGLSNLQGVLQNKTGKGAGCVLVPELNEHQNPDDVLGITQYEKGHYFLYYLELLLTEEKFLEFIRNYLKTREGGNIATREFVAELIDFIKSNYDEAKSQEILSKIDFKEWLYSGELPPVIHDSDFEEWKQMESVYDQFKDGKDPENLDIFKESVGLLIAFTQKIMLNEEHFDSDKLAKIDEALHISENKNCEVLVGWYHAALKLNYSVIHDQIYKFLGEVGRMKFVLPLFVALKEVNKEKAESVYDDNKSFYHAICKGQIQKILA
ncbi:unnamed protein product [Moneuplotes crassus]|uniref:Peptidase M1 leukotriene A4 hydrolase/aminopeptidase C-terminal domain-containing protein n=1 Tax=Euplotes crassus TaxID=5936 RepID=A0AAD1U3N5_EUPCR|nr:unnamed protein product [Moneuplotes crassus]